MLCQGVQYTTDHSIYTKCLSYIGNIMLCLEEGVTTLPMPVENFHATFVEDDRVTLVWDPVKKFPDNFAGEQKIDQFEIYYKRLQNNSSPASAFEHEAVSLKFSEIQIFRNGSLQIFQKISKFFWNVLKFQYEEQNKKRSLVKLRKIQFSVRNTGEI